MYIIRKGKEEEGLIYIVINCRPNEFGELKRQRQRQQQQQRTKSTI